MEKCQLCSTSPAKIVETTAKKGIYLPSCINLVVVYRAWATLVWSCLCILICTVFLSAVVQFLPLSPLPSVHSKYIFLWGKLYFFVLFKQIPFWNFSLCSLKYLASFSFHYQYFASVSSRLFIYLYIVIKSHLSFFVSVDRCISFNLPPVRSSKSGTILVAILCILCNFNTCIFFCEDHITFEYCSFGLIIV